MKVLRIRHIIYKGVEIKRTGNVYTISGCNTTFNTITEAENFIDRMILKWNG